jgi:hypothetical protein
MYELPDGSGFFTATIYSERPPGFIMWLKARPNGTCRRWLLLWRNYRTARVLSRLPEQGPPMSHWHAARWAFAVSY